MTVADLIKVLSGMPQDATVVCGGFDESGVAEVQAVEIVHIVRDHHKGSHTGPHALGTDDEEVAVWIDWNTTT